MTIQKQFCQFQSQSFLRLGCLFLHRHLIELVLFLHRHLIVFVQKPDPFLLVFFKVKPVIFAFADFHKIVVQRSLWYSNHDGCAYHTGLDKIAVFQHSILQLFPQTDFFDGLSNRTCQTDFFDSLSNRMCRLHVRFRLH